MSVSKCNAVNLFGYANITQHNRQNVEVHTCVY